MSVRRYYERSLVLERHARHAAAIAAHAALAVGNGPVAGDWARLSYRLGRKALACDRAGTRLLRHIIAHTRELYG